MDAKKTKALTKVLDEGFSVAKTYSGNPIDALCSAAIRFRGGYAAYILGNILQDWELDSIKKRLSKNIKSNITAPAGFDEEELRGEVLRELEKSCLECCPESDTLLNTGHLLLYILGSKDSNSARILQSYNVTKEDVTENILMLPDDEDDYMKSVVRNSGTKGAKNEDGGAKGSSEAEDMELLRDIKAFSSRRPGSKTASILSKFCTDMTAVAAKDGYDAVIGRQEEIERMMQILNRRKKRNPIIIGEAGVGKTAIVEGLASRIAEGNVMANLQKKRIYSLDMAALVAGTKYRGEFEERMKVLIDALEADNDAILFIDEIHTIVGAGSTQGGLDSANILKPALARGIMQCIGTTTLDEFREKIESDSALERRFQKILVEPTSPEVTLEILHKVKGRYEEYHSVTYTDGALKACVDLAERYITDRNFPDKAIDILDEVGAKAHMVKTKEPVVIEEMQEVLERTVKEKNFALAQGKYYEASKAIVMEQALRARIKQVREEAHHSVRQSRIVITEEHVQEVVSLITGIPVRKISRDERTRLRNMAEHLDKVVIGQRAAVENVTKSIQRARVGLKDPNRPIGVFMFVGPTGVGKTLLAKELARWMFDSADALVRIDMSEYSEKHNVSRMIGSPPGYVGHGQGGQLTETIRRQPYSVVLFDEIEKAHPDVFNIMLQIFDDGQLTDGQGRRVDFRNTVIIMTSNVGVKKSDPMVPIGYYCDPVAQECADEEQEYTKALENVFPPEFINRIDDIVVFNSLTPEDIRQIAFIEADKLQKRSLVMGYKLEISPEVLDELARVGYDSRYGARSLKRAVVDMIEEPFSEFIISGELEPDGGQVTQATMKDGKIVFQIKSGKKKSAAGSESKKEKSAPKKESRKAGK